MNARLFFSEARRDLVDPPETTRENPLHGEFWTGMQLQQPHLDGFQMGFHGSRRNQRGGVNLEIAVLDEPRSNGLQDLRPPTENRGIQHRAQLTREA